MDLDVLGLGPVTARRTLAGGFSHRTDLVTLGATPVVVRTGGGDPAIEAAVMRRAAALVEVPEVLLVGEDTLVISYVEGTPLSHVLDGGGSPERMHALGAEVGRAAAAVREIDLGRRGFFTGPDLEVKEEPPWSEQLSGVAAWCMDRTPDERLDRATRAAWRDLCARHAPALRPIDDDTRLVHADLNPKNILIGPDDRVAALLDWEYAFAGAPAVDAGNMARFGADYPPGFLAGFAAAFPADPLIARVLDMFALSDLVTRAPGHEVADAAAAVIRRWVAEGVPVTVDG